MTENIDINETEVLKQYPEVLEMLLKDHTTQQNIYWATDSYADRDESYQFKDAITVDSITGDNGMIIRPRSVKSKDEQTKRSNDMAEVFTPSWVCNAQNNLIDDAWFGKKGVFNSESPDHTWKATSGNDRVKCDNVISYIKTRLFKFLVGIKKPTQNLKDQTFSLVPMQDFSEPWTDEKLYAKYGITPDEQAYIESLIKPME